MLKTQLVNTDHPDPSLPDQSLVFKIGSSSKMQVMIFVFTATFHIPDAFGRKEEPSLLWTWSVSQPRGLIRVLAKIEITDSNPKVEYYTRDHELYPELTKEFSRW